MSFLATQTSSRLANPGLFENQIRNYFRASNNVVQQSKTIADRQIFDAKSCDGLTEVTLFSGSYNQAVTNLEGSYVRPSSEHVIVYGIRVFTDNGTDQSTFSQGDCVWQKGFTTGNNPIATGDINSEIPAPAINVSLTCNGVVYLNDVWGMDMDSDIATMSRGTLYLNNPIVWPGQTSLELTFSLQQSSNGVTYPSNYSLRADLLGVGLI